MVMSNKPEIVYQDEDNIGGKIPKQEVGQDANQDTSHEEKEIKKAKKRAQKRAYRKRLKAGNQFKTMSKMIADTPVQNDAAFQVLQQELAKAKPRFETRVERIQDAYNKAEPNNMIRACIKWAEALYTADFIREKADRTAQAKYLQVCKGI